MYERKAKQSKLNTRKYHDGFEQPLCWLPHFPVFILVRPENLNLSLGGGDKNQATQRIQNDNQVGKLVGYGCWFT